MSNRIQNLSQERIDLDQPKKEIIPRENWQQIIIKPTVIPAFIIGAAIFVGFLIIFSVFFLILLWFAASIDAEFSGMLFLGLIFLGALLITAIYVAALIIRYMNLKYTIIPGQVENLNNKVMDQLPSKVVVESGFLAKSSLVLNLDELDRIKILRPLLGKFFNYGHIYLEQVDKLQQTQDFILENVKDPEKVGAIIQRLIDYEASNAQPTAFS